MTYPKAGPKKGTKIQRLAGDARWAGRKVSLIVPTKMANVGAKQNPARKRKMHSPAKVGLNPAPIVNKVPSSIIPAYTGYLPTVSERGPPTTGPSPSAKVYSDVGNIATVLLTPNSFMSSGWLKINIETATDLGYTQYTHEQQLDPFTHVVKVANETATTCCTFRLVDQL